jgi:protein gp37
MAKTKIEWCDYTINPVKGLCPMACPYCYARRMYKRFKWNPKVQFDVEGYLLDDWGLLNIRKPSMIFVGSTMELFGDWIQPTELETIFQVTRRYPQHTFIFLTKQPLNLTRWSPFPDNCWVGVSATDASMFTHAWTGLKDTQAKVKFVSIEPLLKWDMSVSDTEWTIQTAGINWLIIGQQTPASPKTSPKIEWLKEIVQAADKAGVPVFIKGNLNSCEISDYPELLDKQTGNLRQEFPVSK